MRQKMGPKLMVPQQIRAATPPLIGSVIVGGWDGGDWRTLNLDSLRQLWRLGERLSVVGKLDSRDAVSATITSGSAVGTVGSVKLTVPAGELWFIEEVDILVPYGAGTDIIAANFRVSTWPDDATVPSADGKNFWASAKVLVNSAAEIFNACFFTGAPAFDKENMDVPLRLSAGDYLTLHTVLSGVLASVSLSATLTPYGYKATLGGV